MDNSLFSIFSILITNRLINHAYAIDKKYNMVIFFFSYYSKIKTFYLFISLATTLTVYVTVNGSPLVL
jgi:hypothetical protein